MAPQTPRQRQQNSRYASSQAAKMGTYRPPKADRETRRKMGMGERFGNPGVSRWLVYLLLFVLVGGGLFELLRLFF